MKKVLLIIAIIFLSITTIACKPRKPHSIILFNNNPISRETLLNNATEFDSGKRIYFIFMTKKPIKTDKIRIKIFQRDNKAKDFINKLVYSNDFKLNKSEIHYYTDYIVMPSSGNYCMMVYQMERLDRPEAVADFKIK